MALAGLPAPLILKETGTEKISTRNALAKAVNANRTRGKMCGR